MSKRLAATCAFLLCLCSAFILADAQAQEPAPEPQKDSANEIRSGLNAVYQRIAKAEKQLAEVRSKKGELEVQAKELDAQVATAEKQSAEVGRSLQAATDKFQQVEALEKQAQIRFETQRELFERRLIGMYKTKRKTAQVDFLFNAQSATDLVKRAHYLSLIAERDDSDMDRLQKMVDQARRAAEQLELAMREREIALQQSEKAQEELRQKLAKKAALLEEQTAKAKEQERAVRKMQADAQRQEQLLAKLMGDKSVPAPIVEVDEPDEPIKLKNLPKDNEPVVGPTPAPVEIARVPTTPPAEFEGGGLAKSKGKLDFPVPGEIVQTFGEQRHEEFEDLMVKKGIEVAAPSGSEVKAVAAGRVAFAQVLPGLGQVLIVDHGKRYYSLYGRLTANRCAVGQVVQKGETVAVVGEPDRRGRNFYFEIRLQGKAIDPRSFFPRNLKKRKKVVA